jgi:hypothetical protein
MLTDMARAAHAQADVDGYGQGCALHRLMLTDMARAAHSTGGCKHIHGEGCRLYRLL